MGKKLKFNETLGLELKEFRNRYSVKAKDVAEELKKSPAYITKLEKGQIQQIEKNDLVKITNYITKSEDGYYIFCDNIAKKADEDELNSDIMLLNFDMVDRKIPVSRELSQYIKKRMQDLDISAGELATYINENEDLDLNFFLQHKIDPQLVEKNVWHPFTEADSIERSYSFIVLEFDKERIQNFIDEKISKCEYIFLYAIMYHILKLEQKKYVELLDDEMLENCKEEAQEILLQYKFYTLSMQSKYSKQSNTEEEYYKLLNEFDINNKKYIASILSEINFLSKYDVSYTNEKLEIIVENMKNCDASFVLAYMAKPLDSLKDLQPSIKRKFLSDISDLVVKYSEIIENGDNVEKY